MMNPIKFLLSFAVVLMLSLTSVEAKEAYPCEYESLFVFPDSLVRKIANSQLALTNCIEQLNKEGQKDDAAFLRKVIADIDRNVAGFDDGALKIALALDLDRSKVVDKKRMIDILIDRTAVLVRVSHEDVMYVSTDRMYTPVLLHALVDFKPIENAKIQKLFNSSPDDSWIYNFLIRRYQKQK